MHKATSSLDSAEAGADLRCEEYLMHHDYSEEYKTRLLETIHHYRSIWTTHPHRNALYNRIVSSKPGDGWQIKEAVAMGIGPLQINGKANQPEVPIAILQLVVFLDIVSLLRRESGQKIDIWAQDPLFRPVDVAVLRELGIEVIWEPDACSAFRRDGMFYFMPGSPKIEHLFASSLSETPRIMVTMPRKLLEESAKSMLDSVVKDLDLPEAEQFYLEADQRDWEAARHNLKTLEKVYCGFELIEDRVGSAVGDPFVKAFEHGQEVWIRRVEQAKKNEECATTRHSTLACLLLQGAANTTVSVHKGRSASVPMIVLERRNWGLSVA